MDDFWPDFHFDSNIKKDKSKWNAQIRCHCFKLRFKIIRLGALMKTNLNRSNFMKVTEFSCYLSDTVHTGLADSYPFFDGAHDWKLLNILFFTQLSFNFHLSTVIQLPQLDCFPTLTQLSNFTSNSLNVLPSSSPHPIVIRFPFNSLDCHPFLHNCHPTLIQLLSVNSHPTRT